MSYDPKFRDAFDVKEPICVITRQIRFFQKIIPYRKFEVPFTVLNFTGQSNCTSYVN